MSALAALSRSGLTVARLQIVVPNSTGYAPVCVSNYAGIRGYARVCASMHEYARVCTSMREYARACASMREYARVCASTGMREYA